MYAFSRRFGAGVALLALLCLAYGCENDKPPIDPIDDRAGILNPERRDALAAQLNAVRDDLRMDIRLVTLAEATPDIDETADALFELKEIGRSTGQSRGALFVVDPTGKQSRLEVGYGLEGVFPDSFAGQIRREQMTAFFGEGRVADGIAATVELLVSRARGKDIVRTPMPTTPEHTGGGAGASGKAPIGHDAPAKPLLAPDERETFGPAPSPNAALERYQQVLAARIKDPSLGLYTPESRTFLKQWTVTDAQQANELQGLSKAWPHAKVLTRGDHAVLRFLPEMRTHAPYLLKRGEAGWMIDFAAMNRLIGFNHKNEWHFKSREHAYSFGFVDWRFDANGFPHGK